MPSLHRIFINSFTQLELSDKMGSYSMMASIKKISLLLIYMCICAIAIAQHNFNDSIANSRNHITLTAMTTLGAWAAANIATGFIIAGQTQGEAKYFWQMNAYWNLVNGELAVM